MKSTKGEKKSNKYTADIERALRLAVKDARKVARFYGTPIYFWRDGKVVVEKP